LPGKNDEINVTPIPPEDSGPGETKSPQAPHQADDDLITATPTVDSSEPTAWQSAKPVSSLLRLNTRLKHADREYVVQSTVDPASKRIRCDIFGEGVRLTAIDGEEIAGVPTARVFPTLQAMHERTVGELGQIFKLSQSATDAREPTLLNYIGELFASRQMWLEARREFDRAVLLSPEYDRALFNLGSCYSKLNLYTEAAEYLERAVKLKPSYPDYLNCLGEAHMELSSCRKALEQFRQAAQLNPYFWEPYYNMGLAHILNGVRREDYRMHVDLKRKAMDMFDKAAVILPSLRSGAYFLGQRYLEEDRLAESYSAYTEAKEKANGDPQPIPVSPLGLALCSNRFMPSESELSAEIARLRDEVRVHPHYADLRFRLAQSYTILAQLVHRRAISEYERALEANPDFSAAWRNKKLAENEDQGLSVLVRATLKSGHLDSSNAPGATNRVVKKNRAE